MNDILPEKALQAIEYYVTNGLKHEIGAEGIKELVRSHRTLSATTREQAAELEKLRALRIKYGPICLVCGAAEPCNLKDGPHSPCTFDPLWDKCQQQAARIAELEAELAEQVEAKMKFWQGMEEMREQRTELEARLRDIEQEKNRLDHEHTYDQQITIPDLWAKLAQAEQERDKYKKFHEDSIHDVCEFEKEMEEKHGIEFTDDYGGLWQGDAVSKHITKLEQERDTWKARLENRWEVSDGKIEVDIVKYKKLLEDLGQWKKAFHSVTPGGSEYANDPQACVDFVRKSRSDQHEAILKFKQERDELLKEKCQLQQDHAGAGHPHAPTSLSEENVMDSATDEEVRKLEEWAEFSSHWVAPLVTKLLARLKRVEGECEEYFRKYENASAAHAGEPLPWPEVGL
jgi:hypothetical protein